MLLQVHDELLFEAPEAEVERLTGLAREVLESAMTLTVPLLDEAERSLGSGLVFRRGLDPAKEC
jgi:DNA polymerase I-like protein with 3'-5' exonuclease and polymerase domains